MGKRSKGETDRNQMSKRSEKRNKMEKQGGCHTCLACHIRYITKQNKRSFQICVDVIAIDGELVLGVAETAGVLVAVPALVTITLTATILE